MSRCLSTRSPRILRPYCRRLLIRLDGTGASHGLIEHLPGLSTTRRKIASTSGFTLTAVEERATAMLPT
jgi:hypothetical protein